MNSIKQLNETQNTGLIIGSVKLNSKVMFAPMAGITDMVMRQIINFFI